MSSPHYYSNNQSRGGGRFHQGTPRYNNNNRNYNQNRNYDNQEFRGDNQRNYDNNNSRQYGNKRARDDYDYNGDNSPYNDSNVSQSLPTKRQARRETYPFLDDPNNKPRKMPGIISRNIFLIAQTNVYCIYAGGMVKHEEVELAQNVAMAKEIIIRLGDFSQMTDEDDILTNITASAAAFSAEGT